MHIYCHALGAICELQLLLTAVPLTALLHAVGNHCEPYLCGLGLFAVQTPRHLRGTAVVPYFSPGVVYLFLD